MGFAKEEKEEIIERFNDDEFDGYLEELIESGDFESDMHEGITRKVLEQGYESLSPRQQNVFLYGVIAPNFSKCKRCETWLWEEMSFIVETGYCTYCNQMNKDD